MKTLEIEWKHLDVDGKTCPRCAGTGDALQEVVDPLAQEYSSLGWVITFKETKLTPGEAPESNAILLNGKPIDEVLPGAQVSESHCESCSELAGKPISCRTYDGGPASLVRRAVGHLIYCC